MPVLSFDASQTISGIFDTSRLGSGVADNTKYLRGDQSWQVIDLTPYVPYTGATADLDMGVHDVTATEVRAVDALFIGAVGGSVELETSLSDRVALLNGAGGSTLLFQLNGKTSSRPAIKQTGTTVAFRLADDSADAPITASNATLSGSLKFGTTPNSITGTGGQIEIRSDNGLGNNATYTFGTTGWLILPGPVVMGGSVAVLNRVSGDTVLDSNQSTLIKGNGSLGLTIASGGAATFSGNVRTPSGSYNDVSLQIGSTSNGFSVYSSGLWVTAGGQAAANITDTLFGLRSGMVLSWSANSNFPNNGDDVKILRNTTAQLDVRADSGVRFRNFANSADAPITCSNLTVSGIASIGTAPYTKYPLNVGASSFAGLTDSDTVAGFYNATFGFNNSTVRIIAGATGTSSLSLGNYSNEYARIASNAAGSVEFNTGVFGTYAAVRAGAATFSGTVKLGTYTVGTLPSAAANTGATAYVTDSSVTTWGSTVAAGGANNVEVRSNGTNWTVTGI